MASSFQTLDTSYLIELLAKQCSTYTNLLKEGIDSPEFKLCKTWIQILQKEINLRNLPDNKSTITSTYIKLEENENLNTVFSIAS